MKAKIINILTALAIVIALVLVIEDSFRIPVVERSFSTGEIVRITIDGKEVPRSKYKQILKGRHQITHVE